MGIVLSWSVSAHAQGDAAARAAARTMFSEGVALADRGEWAEAADRFERAHQLRPSPVIANNLALAYLELGRFVEASELLRAVAHDEEAPDEIRRAAEAEIGRALASTGRLTLRLVGPTEGLTVTIDDEPVELAIVDQPLPRDPGVHAVAASRDAEVVAREEIEIVSGEDAELTLTIPPLPSRDPEPAPQPRGPDPLAPRPEVERDEGGGGLWWFWTVIGLAVVGGVVAAIVASQSGGTDPVAGNLGIVEVP